MIKKNTFHATTGNKGFQTKIWPILYSEKAILNLVFILPLDVQDDFHLVSLNKLILPAWLLSPVFRISAPFGSLFFFIVFKIFFFLVHFSYLYPYLLWSTCPNLLDKNLFKFSGYFFLSRKIYEQKYFHGRDISKTVEYRRIFFFWEGSPANVMDHEPKTKKKQAGVGPYCLASLI